LEPICGSNLLVVLVVVNMVMVLLLLLLLMLSSLWSWFSKNSFVRLVAQFEGFGGMNQSVELDVGETLGLFGLSVFDNVDVVNCPEGVEVGLQ